MLKQTAETKSKIEHATTIKIFFNSSFSFWKIETGYMFLSIIIYGNIFYKLRLQELSKKRFK